MAVRHYAFGPFRLDPHERRLFSGDVPMELSSRYFDALLLLLQHPGTLLSKERFLQEVWQGIPVTDEAVTQCIKTLRRQLGDSATQPHLIETVPKHGYRFVAPVAQGEGCTPARAPGFGVVLVLRPGEVLGQLAGHGVEVKRGVEVIPAEHLEGRQIVAVLRPW